MKNLIKIISKIYYSIRNNDAANVAGRIALELDAAPAEDTILTSIKNELILLKDRLVTAINPAKIASELEVLDTLRDETYRSLVYLLRGYAHHLDGAIKTAAHEILKVVDKYGLELTQLNYAAESVEIESLIGDVRRADMQDYLTVLPGVVEIVDKLDGEQAQFNVAQKAYLDAIGESEQEQSATAIKKELLSLVNYKLIMYLNGMLQVNPEPYNTLYTNLSNVIDEANALVKRRQNSEGVEASSN